MDAEKTHADVTTTTPESTLADLAKMNVEPRKEPGEPLEPTDDGIPVDGDNQAAKPAEPADDKSGEEKAAPGDGIPAEILSQAKEYGLTEADVHNIGLSALPHFFAAQDRQIAALARPRGQPAAERQPEQPQQPKEKEEAVGAAEDYHCDLNPTEYDEGIIQHFNALGEQVKALKAQLARATKAADRVDAREQQDFEARFDNNIASLGDAYKDTFGEGTIADLERESDAARNRVAVFTEMMSLQAGYRQLGRPVPPEKVLFARAVRSVFGDKETTIARRQISDKLRNRQTGQFIARPSSRREHADAGKLTPVESAEQAVAEKLREFGVT